MADNDMRRRVKDQLPTVLLTMLSIVQALALELLWDHLTHTPGLSALTFETLLAWLQISATFVGVLLVWLIYASTVMRFRWVPTNGDLVFPLFVGMLEFLLVELLGVALLGPWLITFALVFGLMTWSSQATYRRARQDSDNAAFFANTPRATFKDFIWSGAVVVVLAALGLALWLSGHTGWFAAVSVAAVLSVLLYQLYLSAVFWRRSVFD